MLRSVSHLSQDLTKIKKMSKEERDSKELEELECQLQVCYYRTTVCVWEGRIFFDYLIFINKIVIKAVIKYTGYLFKIV